LRSQLDAEKKRSDELEEELDDREKEVAELRRNLSDRETELAAVQSELSDLKQKSATARELPEAAELLNQLKSKRKKSTTTLADIEAILEMIEE